MYSSTSVPSSAPDCTASARDKGFRSISSPIVNPATPRPETCVPFDWEIGPKVIDHGCTGKSFGSRTLRLPFRSRGSANGERSGTLSWSFNDQRLSGSCRSIEIAFLNDALVILVGVSDPVLEITAYGRHELRDFVRARRPLCPGWVAASPTLKSVTTHVILCCRFHCAGRPPIDSWVAVPGHFEARRPTSSHLRSKARLIEGWGDTENGHRETVSMASTLSRTNYVSPERMMVFVLHSAGAQVPC
jgi:hypothetical protein